MSMQRPQLQDELNIVMQKWEQSDWNALFTLKNYGGYNRFFLAFFRLAKFLCGGFSVNAENIQLGG